MSQERNSSEASQGGLPPLPRRGFRLLRFWFGVVEVVSPKAYFFSGVGLMVFKYAIEAIMVAWFSGRYFSPLDFLNPLLSMREEFFRPPVPEWVPWFVFFWSLPFLWIAVSMSVRRAANAGFNPWVGLTVLCPLLNLLAMIALSIYPQRNSTSRFSEPADLEALDEIDRNEDSYGYALLGILLSNLISVVMVGISVYAFKDYGVSLFLGTPIVMGAVSAFAYNRPVPRSFGGSLLVSQIAILTSGGVLLLFAFEGLICLLMLYPIASVMALLGGMIGHYLSWQTSTNARDISWVILLLPFLAGAEAAYRPVPTYEVVSSVLIDAPPERVWEHVIGFSELPDPTPWYFRLGIAYPQRATIDGEGVGAVRRCEFSTGAFVEPITEWRFPERLAFDVASQPPPMHEFSPYRHVHPPHLDGYLRCRKGEFRLVRLTDERTRLEGSTWYEFEMYPQDYWTLWSDAAIHRIHMRVLEHIKRLAEASDRGAKSE